MSFFHPRAARRRDWLLTIMAMELLFSAVALALAQGLLLTATFLGEAGSVSPYARLRGDCRFSAGWAWTDRGRPIRIRRCSLPPPDLRAFETEDAWLRGQALSGIAVRTGDPGPYCNCFGWAFTGGRFAVDDDIDVILEDNGYAEVCDPQPGDLVVYQQQKALVHVGIVRGFDTHGDPVIESKWGARARYHHPLHAYPVPAAYSCVFYRSPRRGHDLRGLSESWGTAGAASEHSASTDCRTGL